MKFTYHKDRTLLPSSDNWVWVFGSNLAGIHGAGAAKQAIKYGAKYGHGIGIQGWTYAIPTKDHDIKTMPIINIVPYIERFERFTKQYPQLKFFVTAIGTGLAGYTDKDMAPLFKNCGPNCCFPEQWQSLLET